jgi:dTDP-4-dehydrorhamnose reductase
MWRTPVSRITDPARAGRPGGAEPAGLAGHAGHAGLEALKAHAQHATGGGEDPPTAVTAIQPGPPDPSQGPVVVLGHTGMLGQALMRVAAARGWRTLGISRRSVPGLSLARQSNLGPWLDPLCPALVINAAAITDLGANEADPSSAMELHARLPGLLADWGRRRGTPWVQISTDHYWVDNENTLHDERAQPRPPNTYARTKHEGEQLAQRDPGALVLRTNIVGFRGRAGEPTFAEWVMASLARGEPFDTYTDVWASSIEVEQFSHALFDLVEIGVTGLVNLASRETLSKADFIEALARASGHGTELLRRVSRPRSRPRRANAMGLDVARAEAWLGRKLPTADEVIGALVASPAMPGPTVHIHVDAGDVSTESAAQGAGARKETPDVLLT